jgi:DNA-binding NarL/FixJ family response regulator
MNLSPPLQYAMTQINHAFVVVDQTALVAALTSVHLPELLSQDMHEKLRDRGKSALAIFLATLTCNNEVEESAARYWPDCYQSISQKQLLASLQALIRVNCVMPGRTDTEMRSTNFHKEEQEILYNPYEVAVSASRIIYDSANGTLARVQ